MHVLSRRLRALAVASLATAILLATIGPSASLAADPPGLSRFMRAIAKVESGGRYQARNPISGAYGKYQILPSNWPTWARMYLGNAGAPQSPRNQEKVAAGKFKSLHRWLGSWRRVAYWWLTGSARRSGWSGMAKTYVSKVMRYYGARDTGGHKAARGKRIPESSAAIAYTGRWKTARHEGYGGDRARYATAAGASATFTFTGRRITWYGPVGPTRGKAKVYVNGRYVDTVDLHSGAFRARVAVFSRGWKTAAPRTLTIKVLGTRGHSMVAVDEFVVVK